MPHQGRFARISDGELLRRLSSLLGDSRRVEADLVDHIAEVDDRRLYARQACPSMFAYCTQVLHLSEAEAGLRITVARTARSHPALLEMLADGRLHLSGVAKLAPHLTPENAAALLERAAHRSKGQIEELVAELAPRPDVQATIRKLPAAASAPSSVSVSCSVSVPASVSAPCSAMSAPCSAMSAPCSAMSAPCSAMSAPGSMVSAPGSLVSAPGSMVSAPGSMVSAPGSMVSAPGSMLSSLPFSDGQHRPDGVASTITSACAIQPLAPERYKVQFTAGAELRRKLERLQNLMAADLANAIEQAVTEKLGRLERKRFALTKSPRSTSLPDRVRVRTRYVPAPLKRAVYVRDEGRCRYTDAEGRRCQERGRLEYHHRHPYALGGQHSLKDVCLMCHTHNQHEAEHDFGKAVMARHRSGRLGRRGSG